LEELYLSHNGVERLEGLENNTKLRTLDVGVNFVPAIENISHLVSLEELWLNNNKIADLRALEPQLKSMESLETIYLEGNPCQQAEGTGYRRKIMLALPQVKQIDATFARLL
jgi:protein phosphatase 1 regulatory subunit 7